ncbi:MAG: hypothetical protein AB1894_04520 [Chloroflexota bacterium]
MKTQFIKDFIRNLVILAILGIVLFVLFPDIMRQVFELYSALLGPIAILVVVVAALPQKKRKRQR